VEKLRNRQVKNFLTVTMLSLGVPMILMGDEVRRTQRGNNNAYCQDSEISWFDWRLVAKHADVHRFMSLLAARRLRRDVEHERRRMSLNQLLRQAKIAWHGVKLTSRTGAPVHTAWRSPRRSERKNGFSHDPECVLEPLDFDLPPVGNGDGNRWRRWIDTALDSPQTSSNGKGHHYCRPHLSGRAAFGGRAFRRCRR